MKDAYKHGCSSEYEECLEIKSLSAEDSLIHGYASVFSITDQHNDIVLPGAFKESVERFNSGKMIPILWQHIEDKPIGMVEKIEEDEYGLYISGRILNSIRYGREAIDLIKAQIICGFSIGYSVINSRIDYEANSRIIHKIDLWEISIVTFPANEETLITSIS
ncbi:MAG: HK97 family phage prohead protease [Alphaproteobacteria bacterium]|nr:HK97 family phage prohead protease [Alphaproteobacteria bacterium]